MKKCSHFKINNNLCITWNMREKLAISIQFTSSFASFNSFLLFVCISWLFHFYIRLFILRICSPSMHGNESCSSRFYSFQRFPPPPHATQVLMQAKKSKRTLLLQKKSCWTLHKVLLLLVSFQVLWFGCLQMISTKTKCMRCSKLSAWQLCTFFRLIMT